MLNVPNVETSSLSASSSFRSLHACATWSCARTPAAVEALDCLASAKAGGEGSKATSQRTHAYRMQQTQTQLRPIAYLSYHARIHRLLVIMGPPSFAVNTLAAHAKDEASKSDHATPQNDGTNGTKALIA
eukprot:6179090-Pleurochrysis_carterae.AAC.2